MSEELGDYMFVPRGSVIESEKDLNEVYKTIDILHKKLDDKDVEIVAMCAENKSIEDERDALRKQLEIAVKTFDHLDDVDEYTSIDTVHRIVAEGRAEIEKVSNATESN